MFKFFVVRVWVQAQSVENRGSDMNHKFINYASLPLGGNIFQFTRVRHREGSTEISK